MHGLRCFDASGGGRWWRRLTLPALALAVSAPVAAAADTRAGVGIVNVATLTVRDAQGDVVIRSNPVTLTVAERLDVALTRIDDAGIAIAPGGTPVPLLLVNRGNGHEAFNIAATLADAGARVRLVAIDRDGDGRFDPAIDTPLTAGQTPPLDAGEAVRLVVVLDPAGAGGAASTLTVVATAVTGSGTPGTAYPALGDDGGDAVAGPTGARAEVAVPIGTAAAADGPTLLKSQSVRAPDGTATPMIGAVITYRLEARFIGPTAAARIADPIPQGTAYVPGSLTLDALRLSDAADGDAGAADAAGIAVDLGDIAAAGARTVQFQVTIQ